MGQITAFGRIALPVMSNEQNHIHGEGMFTAFQSAVALGSSATLLIEIRVPEGWEMHLKGITFYTGSDGQLELIEAPTITPGTAGLSGRNRRRSSVKLSVSTLFSDPTGISGGIVLEDMFVAGGAQSAGSERGTDLEWVLKAGTTLVRLTNLATGVQPCDVRIDWYDEKKD